MRGMLARSSRRIGALVARAFAAVLGLCALGATFVPLGACSLGNIERDDCTSNDQCVLTIGPNSKCEGGYCTDPPACQTGHDCRKIAGGGACVEGVCVSVFPKDEQCGTIFEPANLPDLRLAGPDAPLVIGTIFSLGSDKDEILTRVVRLAVRQINKSDKMNRGQSIAVVACDNGGPGNTATGAERDALNNHAIDYLAGTLGVPYIVGPLSSSDSLRLIARIKDKGYPTVVISPSATSPALTQTDDRLAPSEPGLFWRTCPSDVQQGAVMATNVITPDMTVNKVAVVYVSDAYGQGLAEVFQQQYGLDKSQLFPIDDAKLADATVLGNLADDVAAYGPNGVLVITVQAGQTVSILKAMVGKPYATTAKFFFTDGAKDAGVLLDPGLPPEVQAIIAGAKGTAPASPAGQVYNTFAANLNAEFQINASDYSFLAQAYDATFVGAYGVIWASRAGTSYDGRDVATGMGKLSAGTSVPVGLTGWSGGKADLTADKSIDLEGTSGTIQFNADTGEAPGRIEMWSVANGAFMTDGVIEP